jgi:hypothetical protein
MTAHRDFPVSLDTRSRGQSRSQVARRVSVEQSLLVPLAGLSAPVSSMIWDLRLLTRTYSGIPMRVSLLAPGDAAGAVASRGLRALHER